MGFLKSEREQLAKGSNLFQAIRWSRQATLQPAVGLSCQEPLPPVGSRPGEPAQFTSLFHLPGLKTLVGDVGGGGCLLQRPGPRRALLTTLEPGTQHSPGLGGHGAQEVTPQKAPTLPQQSSWAVSSGRGLAHWGKKDHGHSSPASLSRTEMSQESLSHEFTPHILPENAPTQGRGEEALSQTEVEKPEVHPARH